MRLIGLLLLALLACRESDGDTESLGALSDIERVEIPKWGIVCYVYKAGYAGGLDCEKLEERR